MTTFDRAALERHRSDAMTGGGCTVCGRGKWPCDAALALTEIDKLTTLTVDLAENRVPKEWLAESEQERVELVAQVEQLQKAQGEALHALGTYWAGECRICGVPSEEGADHRTDCPWGQLRDLQFLPAPSALEAHDAEVIKADHERLLRTGLFEVARDHRLRMEAFEHGPVNPDPRGGYDVASSDRTFLILQIDAAKTPPFRLTCAGSPEARRAPPCNPTHPGGLPMTTDETLRQLAEAAMEHGGDWYRPRFLPKTDNEGGLRAANTDDTAFILACKPSTILALLTDKARLTARVAELEAALSHCDNPRNEPCECGADEANALLDHAAAALADLERSLETER